MITTIATFEKDNPYDLLCELTEAHLTKVPFENLAQHGGKGGGVVLNLDAIANKILDRNRGGFCLELNVLFGALLQDLGFQIVTFPAIVYKADEGGFDHPATHIALVATATTTAVPSKPESNNRYFVDVGFAEPPLHPLQYTFDKEQITPEGMKSRMIQPSGTDDVILEWFVDGEWQPRLKWNLSDSLPDQRESDHATTSKIGTQQKPTDFQHILDLVYAPTANFSRKLIICRLTREKKYTLAGHILKTTSGSPTRFDELTRQKISKELDTLDEIQAVLKDVFGIPLDESQQIDVTDITAQDPNAFSGM